MMDRKCLLDAWLEVPKQLMYSKCWRCNMWERSCWQISLAKPDSQGSLVLRSSKKGHCQGEMQETKGMSWKHKLVPNLWEGLPSLYWPYQPPMNTSPCYLNHLFSWFSFYPEHHVLSTTLIHEIPVDENLRGIVFFSHRQMKPDDCLCWQSSRDGVSIKIPVPMTSLGWQQEGHLAYKNLPHFSRNVF